MASLLDVDVHAACLHRAGREMLVVNHYGRVRAFEMPLATSRLRPVREWQLLGDTERVVFAHDCFIASSPRGEYTVDPAQPGVFLFEPVTRPKGASTRLDCDQVLAEWDVTSAISFSEQMGWLAVASGQRIGVFALAPSATGAGLRLGACQWEAEVGCHCQWLHFDALRRLWTGGYRLLRSDPEGDHWDACRGGGIAAFDAGGTRVFDAELPDETAWGYGADPIVLSPDAGRIFVLGRNGSLHAVTTERGSTVQLHAAIDAPGRSAEIEKLSLGIGHAALREGWLYAGFSRGGCRLLRYDLRAEDALASPRM